MVMASTINTASYQAKYNVDRSSAANQESISRISKGSKLIRASDDSAALTISSKLKATANSMDQGRSNILQGIYMLQIGAGGLTEIDKTLTRLKTLTTQAVNDTLTGSELAYIQTEINTLVDQIDLTAQQTRYKGTSLLVGTQGSAVYTHADKSVSDLSIVEGFIRTDGNNDGDFDDIEDHGDETFNADLSGGFILKSFNGEGDVLVSIEETEILLDIDGEIFAAENTVTLGEPIVFISKTNSENRLALNVTGDATEFEAIDTDTELVASLKALLANAEIKIGLNESLTGLDIAGANTEANDILTPGGGGTASIFHSEQLINTRLSYGVVQGEVESITVVGDRTDYTIEATVGGEVFRATSVQLENSAGVTLTSVVDSGNAFSLTWGNDVEDIAAYPDGGVAPDPENSAAFLERILTTAFSTDDGAGGRTPAVFNIGRPEAMYGAPETIEGFNVPGNVDPADPNLLPLNTLNTKGFIDGFPTVVSVTPNGENMDVSLTVGQQVFTQRSFHPTNNGQLNLVSETDGENVISLNLSGNAEESLNNSEALRARLELLMGLGPDGGAVVRFQSASGEYHEYNGVRMGYDTSLTTQPGTPPGSYAISYDVGNRSFKLTDGQTVERIEVTSAVNQTLAFSNGVLFEIGTATQPFDPSLPMSQVVFTVEAGTNTSVNFQLSAQPGDEKEFVFEPATSNALGLTLLRVATHEQARDSQRAIEIAIGSVNTNLATIGAVMVQFESLANNINTQILNTRLSRQDFYDSDFAFEMIEFTRSQTLLEAGVSMLSQANSLPETLLRLIQ